MFYDIKLDHYKMDCISCKTTKNFTDLPFKLVECPSQQGQWKAGLQVLNYFNVEAPPRTPLLTELTHYPSRSRYYETFLCTWTFAFSILLIHSLEYVLSRRPRGRLFLKNSRQVTALQFVLLVVPFQICVLDFPVKFYPHFVLPFNAMCLLFYLACLGHKLMSASEQISLAVIGVKDDAHQSLPVSAGSGDAPAKSARFNNLLSIYRSIVYISTAVCIFARDQPCWNNDFSKTYSFGTGLMDVGIGLFVICIGSLGPTALRRPDYVNVPLTIRKAFLQAAILSACGLVKSILVVLSIVQKGVKFDDSWREYGVHWNAFYSLAVARILGTCLELALLRRWPWFPPLLAAVVMAALHEALLAWGLAVFVLAPGIAEPYNRSSLVGANREGLASIPGLLTLYLLGLQLGRWTRDNRLGRIVALLLACLAWRPVSASSRGALLPESRRLMNPSYCAWVMAFSCFCVLFASLGISARRCLFADSRRAGCCCCCGGGGADGGVVIGVAMATEEDPASSEMLTPLHLRQVDSAGLLYFLVSNLLTGIFNFCLDQLIGNRESIDGPICFLVVLAYTMAVFCVTRMLETKFSFRFLQDKLMKILFRT